MHDERQHWRRILETAHIDAAELLRRQLAGQRIGRRTMQRTGMTAQRHGYAMRLLAVARIDAPTIQDDTAYADAARRLDRTLNILLAQRHAGVSKLRLACPGRRQQHVRNDVSDHVRNQVQGSGATATPLRYPTRDERLFLSTAVHAGER